MTAKFCDSDDSEKFLPLDNRNIYAQQRNVKLKILKYKIEKIVKHNIEIASDFP